MLLRADPSPVVELNRAVAVAMRDGPQAGLALIDAILARGDLADYHLAHSARADLCRRLGRTAEARASYERALALTRQEPERRFLERRLRELAELKDRPSERRGQARRSSSSTSLPPASGAGRDGLRPSPAPAGRRGARRAEERRAVEHLLLELLEVEVDHRRDVERDELGDDQAADDHQPEGRRDAPSAPKPSAIGTAPITAASVVIRIGRKRSMLASWMRVPAGSPASTRWRAKSTIMMPFFFTMPISMNMPTNA